MNNLINQQEQFALTFKLSYNELRLLMQTYTTENLMICLSLLKAKRYRSSNRKYLADKLRFWLANSERITNYPLTKEQLTSISPKWPINIVIPTI
jgi:hypothetical protein